MANGQQGRQIQFQLVYRLHWVSKSPASLKGPAATCVGGSSPWLWGRVTCSGMSGSSSKEGTLSVQGRNFFVSGSM